MSDVPPICIAKTPTTMRPFAIRRIVKRRGESLPLHLHPEAQLTFAASGMVQVHTEEGVWFVPPQIAAWMPPEVPHRLDLITDAELWLVMWHASAIAEWAPKGFPDRPFALRITPLLRCLLADAVANTPAPGKTELLLRLMLHEMTAMANAPTFLPLPTSDAGRRVADLALGDRRNRMGLDELAERAATSVRTASRLFPQETGMTLKAWRQRARIVSAIGALSDGRSIADVADRAGFSSTAAFCCAFRQVMGVTPTAFLQGPGQAAAQQRALPTHADAVS
ncbi:MAG: helix-turn-helix transcriptional regulator [Pseudoxanthomonas sp.]